MKEILLMRCDFKKEKKSHLSVVYSYADACRNITMQWRRADASLEKYTSHFIWKGY